MPEPGITPYDKSLLVIVDGPNGVELVSVDRKLHKVRWRQAAPGAKWTPGLPHIWHELALVAAPDGTVQSFRAGNGRMEWSLTLSDYIKVIGSTEHLLYVGNQQGKLWVYETE
ncbi:MAG: hypothetical protein GY716_23550 [bacterium]|nr:hypothetical protein [bacterium]